QYALGKNRFREKLILRNDSRYAVLFLHDLIENSYCIITIFRLIHPIHADTVPAHKRCLTRRNPRGRA
ncbi:MAG: hypothetical protein WAL11_17655, partial [Pseudolabrys sp.]